LRNSLKIPCCPDVSNERGPTIDVCEGVVWTRGIVAVEEARDDKRRSSRRPIGNNGDDCSGWKTPVNSGFTRKKMNPKPMP